MTSTSRYEARTIYGVRICGFTERHEAERWYDTPDAQRFPGCTVVEIITTLRGHMATTRECTICAPPARKRA